MKGHPKRTAIDYGAIIKQILNILDANMTNMLLFIILLLLVRPYFSKHSSDISDEDQVLKSMQKTRSNFLTNADMKDIAGRLSGGLRTRESEEDDEEGYEPVRWAFPPGEKIATKRSLEPITDWERKQEKRHEILQHKCKSESMNSEEYDYDMISRDSVVKAHMIVDDIHKTLFCYVPKVSCTNWKRLISVISGENIREAEQPKEEPKKDPEEDLKEGLEKQELDQRQGIVMLDEFTHDQRLERLRTYTKVVFVRNPMERVISAYRDNFEEKTAESELFQNWYGKRIQIIYRSDPANVSMEGVGTSFDEFVRYLIDTSITKSEPMNEHWETVMRLCKPCNVRFDYIGKFESMYEDASEVLDRIRGSVNVSYPTTPDTKRARSYNSYMSQISVVLKDQLQMIYTKDIEGFGYKKMKL